MRRAATESGRKLRHGSIVTTPVRIRAGISSSGTCRRQGAKSRCETAGNRGCRSHETRGGGPTGPQERALPKHGLSMCSSYASPKNTGAHPRRDAAPRQQVLTYVKRVRLVEYPANVVWKEVRYVLKRSTRKYSGLSRCYASKSLAISPCTSVRRKWRPWYLYVRRLWSTPRTCRIVACKSCTCTGLETTL
jgi:hypothetical protein